MNADLSRFKVIYNNRVLNAVSLEFVDYQEGLEEIEKRVVIKPRFIGVLVINEDGILELIHDEAWCFQFIPIVDKERGK